MPVASQLLERLRPILVDFEAPVFLVGGAVRDRLLNRDSHDLDFVVGNKAIKLAFKVADALAVPAYVLDRNRDIGRVVLAEGNHTLDFALIRGGSIEEDLRARDFTINAMAKRVASEDWDRIIDPSNGRKDLAIKVIRQTHAQSINGDPVRALRAVRLATELEFEISAETTDSIRSAATALKSVSVERIRDELLKIIALPTPSGSFWRLSDLGLLEIILPEVADLRHVAQSFPHHEPVMAHSFQVLARFAELENALSTDSYRPNGISTRIGAVLAPFGADLSRYLDRTVEGGLRGRNLTRLGALFHDIGKATTGSEVEDGQVRFLRHEEEGTKLAKQVLTRLRLSNEARRHVGAIVKGHMRPHWLSESSTLSRRAIYRFFRDTKLAGVDICLIALADSWAMRHEGGNTPEREERWERLLSVVQQLLEHYFHRHEETVKPPPLIDGREVMEVTQLKPGPEIGRLLRIITEAQAAGEISTKQEAIELATKGTLKG